MTTVSVQAIRHDMKNKIVHVINNTKASSHDIDCLTRYAITVIAMIDIIKLLKYKIDPVINNTKATNERNKVFALQYH